MAEVTYAVPPGPYTATASAQVLAGQTLVVTGDDTVGPASGASAAFAGVAAFDAPAGAKVTVLNGGIHYLAAAAAVAAGDPVTSAASGGVATLSGTTYSTVIGVALKAAASNKVKVRLFR